MPCVSSPFGDEGKEAILVCLGHLPSRVPSVAVDCHDWEHFNLTAAGLSPQRSSERTGRGANGKYDVKG